MFASVPDILAQAAGRHRSCIAIRMGADRLSYAELDALSNRVANALLAAGLDRRDRVAICLDKSPLAVGCLYGAMKAGGIAVPLDPNGPPGRLAAIVADSEARFLITSGAKAGRLAEAIGSGALERLLLADEVTADAFAGAAVPVNGAEQIRDAEPAPPGVPVHGQDLACLLYTSGSSGTPKGVMITHANIAFFAAHAAGAFGLGPEDVVSCHAPLHFDLTLFDLYASHAAGATVALVPQGIGFMAADLLAWIETEKVNVWQPVPSVLRLLNRQMKGGELASVRHCIFAGEPYPRDELAELMAKAERTRFHNIYGSTEMNDVTCYPVPRPLPEGPLPIGRPWGGAELLVLDEAGAPAALGEPGDLWVRGPTVAAGYWKKPEQTAERFRQNPAHDLFPDRLYRTGDRVYLDRDGLYHFAGRADLLVKIRGNRVDPGEVEAALKAHCAIDAAVVIAVSGADGETALAAFLVMRGTATLDDRALRRHCLAHLPNYMVPQNFTCLAALPQTSTGKTDRQALIRMA